MNIHVFLLFSTIQICHLSLILICNLLYVLKHTGRIKVLSFPQAMIHVRQLKEDLQKERERHDNYMKSSSEKMEKERENVREACREEVGGLVKQVNFNIKIYVCISPL